MDGALSGAERAAVEAHLRDCAACRAEAAAMRRMRAALSTAPQTAPVPPGLEQATLRRVRAALVGDEDGMGGRAWMRGVWWMSAPLAATVVLALVWRFDPGTTPPAEELVHGAPSMHPGTPQATAVARVNEARGAGEQVASASAERPGAPPPQLAETLDLYLDLPLLENLEKLQNFEAIRTVDLSGGEDPGDGQG
jgi:anti-sigma factor RsiW